MMRDDRAHMARKSLGWFQAVGSGAWAAAEAAARSRGAGASAGPRPTAAAASAVPAFVLKTDDDVVLHLPNLRRRLLRILEEGRLLEEDGGGKDAAGEKQPARRRHAPLLDAGAAADPWVYFGRPTSSSIFPAGSVYMQGSLYGFSRALAVAVAAATPPVGGLSGEGGGDKGAAAGGGGRGGAQDQGAPPPAPPVAAAAAARVGDGADPAPLGGHEDYLASQWVLRAVAAGNGGGGGGGGAVAAAAAAAHGARGGWLKWSARWRRPSASAAGAASSSSVVLWANASTFELHDTPLIASEFSLRRIEPARVLAVHNAKHPLEFMHAYGGMVGEGRL